MKPIPAFISKMRLFKRKGKGKGREGGDHGAPGHGFSRIDKEDASTQYADRRQGTKYPSSGNPTVPVPGGAAASRRESKFRPMATRASALALVNLPAHVLRRIFTFVCPQATDDSYETCEDTLIDDACMLCDLRDLAHCVLVCSRWRSEGTKILYHSIRIDSVHYCEREGYLSEKRKHRTFFDRNADPEDTPLVRLKLLCRTLRHDPSRLGPLVQFLKTPYMLRESCQSVLARTIALLPNLKYVDLPEGLFMDEPSFVALRLELQARCPDIRKMTYMRGAERSLSMLATGTVWSNLEVLELMRVDMDPSVMRQVLASLGNLRALKISGSQSFSDEVFLWDDMLRPVPGLEELFLEDVPYVTAEGLKQWLMLPEPQQALRVLSLTRTGVKPWTLHGVVALAPALGSLTISDTVAASLPSATGTRDTPPLTSKSLHTLHYEITAGGAAPSATATTSYYSYLASCLLAGRLPSLRAVYVRDPNFADTLLGLPPPVPTFADLTSMRPASSGSNSPLPLPNPNRAARSHSFLSPTPHPLPPFAPANPAARFSSNNPFAARASPGGPAGGGVANLPHMLEVFAKGDDELDWSFVKVQPGGAALPAAARPVSDYGLGGGAVAAGWGLGAGARRSVFVSEGPGGGGGFLEVPTAGGGAEAGAGAGDLWPRPSSSAGEKRSESMDLWR